VTVTGRRSISESDINSIIYDTQDLEISFLNKWCPDVIINNGYDVNDHLASLRNSLLVVRKSIEYFKVRGSGVIVNVNSIAGLQPDTKNPDYAASKHGLKGYVDSVSLDAYLNNINIINLYPRAISVGITEGRADFSKLINPIELAEFCTLLLKTKSFYVSTIVFDRVNSYDGGLSSS
jgi:NAD(P)-dependent dehydrogenase (short-subunit alcohol dehydrogenase family)